MTAVDLRLGDCLEVMKTLPDGCVDAVITDPPYGVGFSYTDTYDDKRSDYSTWIQECLGEMRRIASVVIVTPGIANLMDYPKPLWICSYFKPGSTRRNGTGGFNEWEPILVYAKKLRIMTDAKRFPDCVNHSKDTGNHPCPKPLNVFRWLVLMGTTTNAIVLDPFMGSGTTGVACIQTGRNFIGIEIDPGYFDIAKKRITDAQAQESLF